MFSAPALLIRFREVLLAKFALDNLKLRRRRFFTTLLPNTTKASPKFLRTSMRKMEARWSRLKPTPPTIRIFSSQLTKIKQAAPELIFLPNYYSEVPLQIQQAKRLGITVPFIGSDSWGSEELVKLCGKDCNDYYFSTHYAADASNLTRRRNSSQAIRRNMEPRG